MRRADGRLITLTGAAGVGKTTLALEVARRSEADFLDGSVLVSLVDLRDGGGLALACCEALGLRDTSARKPAALLTEYLAPRQLLLVLDNCEHLRPAAASLVDRLLDSCPDLRVLATSRAPLRVKGETVFPLPAARDAERADGLRRGDLRGVPSVEAVRRARPGGPSGLRA